MQVNLAIARCRPVPCPWGPKLIFLKPFGARAAVGLQPRAAFPTCAASVHTLVRESLMVDLSGRNAI